MTIPNIHNFVYYSSYEIIQDITITEMTKDHLIYKIMLYTLELYMILIEEVIQNATGFS